MFSKCNVLEVLFLTHERRKTLDTRIKRQLVTNTYEHKYYTYSSWYMLRRRPVYVCIYSYISITTPQSVTLVTTDNSIMYFLRNLFHHHLPTVILKISFLSLEKICYGIGMLSVRGCSLRFLVATANLLYRPANEEVSFLFPFCLPSFL